MSENVHADIRDVRGEAEQILTEMRSASPGEQVEALARNGLLIVGLTDSSAEPMTTRQQESSDDSPRSVPEKQNGD